MARKKKTITVPDFVNVLQGVLGETLRDYGPVLEQQLAAIHPTAEPHQIPSEVLVLAYSLVTQTCTVAFRKNGADVGLALNVWMEEVEEEFARRLAAIRPTPDPAGEFREFRDWCRAYGWPIMDDLQELDEVLARGQGDILPFKQTQARLFLNLLGPTAEVPPMHHIKRLCLEVLLPAAGLLEARFKDLADEFEVENFIRVLPPRRPWWRRLRRG